ncbi:MAG: ribosomal protein L7/L12 [Myxococcota bacterium]
MNIDKQTVKEFLSQLTPPQLAELAQELRAQWQLPEVVDPVVVPRPDPPDPGPPPELDVVVHDVGASRIKVIRALRSAQPGLELRRAVDLLQTLPAVVVGAMERTAAEALLEALRAAGATVELAAPA